MENDRIWRNFPIYSGDLNKEDSSCPRKPAVDFRAGKKKLLKAVS